MAGLQRSAQTFRRSGSSGLVWDERFLAELSAGEIKPGGDGGGGGGARQPELRHSRSVGALRWRGPEDEKKRKLVLARPKREDQRKQQQDGEAEEVPASRTQAFRTRDVAPAADPPSPRVPAGCCAPCAIFRGHRAVAGSSARRVARPRKR